MAFASADRRKEAFLPAIIMLRYHNHYSNANGPKNLINTHTHTHRAENKTKRSGKGPSRPKFATGTCSLLNEPIESVVCYVQQSLIVFLFHLDCCHYYWFSLTGKRVCGSQRKLSPRPKKQKKWKRTPEVNRDATETSWWRIAITAARNNRRTVLPMVAHLTPATTAVRRCFFVSTNPSPNDPAAVTERFILFLFRPSSLSYLISFLFHFYLSAAARKLFGALRFRGWDGGWGGGAMKEPIVEWNASGKSSNEWWREKKKRRSDGRDSMAHWSDGNLFAFVPSAAATAAATTATAEPFQLGLKIKKTKQKQTSVLFVFGRNQNPVCCHLDAEWNDDLRQ